MVARGDGSESGGDAQGGYSAVEPNNSIARHKVPSEGAIMVHTRRL